MDYICTFNNGESEDTYNGVDPDENEDLLKTVFLDLSMQVLKRKFKLFDERQGFSFCIIEFCICIAIYLLKYFIFQSILKLYVLAGSD